MRKLFILMLLLCLCKAGVGQSVSDILAELPPVTQADRLQYWYDDDIGTLRSTQQLNGTHTFDVSALLDGMHTLHVQIIDNTDAICSPCSHAFLKLTKQYSIPSAKQLQYWFDDSETITTAPLSSGVQLLDVNSLLDGLHTVHYLVVDENGRVSTPCSHAFLKLTKQSSIPSAKQLQYWFDDSETITTAPLSSGVQLLDVNSLLDGLHTLHFQVVDENGRVSTPCSHTFLKLTKQSSIPTAKQLQYWFDDSETITTALLSSGVQLLDVNSLLDGLHTLHFQVVDENGRVSTPCSQVFLKLTDVHATGQPTHIRYWFDDDDTTLRESTTVSGLQILDVSELVTGLHTVHVMLADENGRTTVPYTAIFLKLFTNNTPNGKDAITSYKYWVNDNIDDLVKAEIAVPDSTYGLVTLLPIPMTPIRSSSFLFRVEKETPVLYAQNDFHIRFYNAMGYYCDGVQSFADYRVREEVTDITPLLPTQTFARPNENTIKWFSFEACKGDTIAFRSSQATSLQVFSPTGQEIYVASGDKSVKYGGCHTWEDGTYYLAVHDVTGSQANIKLDFMHMDKYDVVSQDVSVVGNGGASTITYRGNGFNDLYAVDFVNSQNDTIRCGYIERINNEEVGILADFNQAALGKYKAIFRFTGEDKVLADAVTVVLPIDITHSLSVSYDNRFLRSRGKSSYSVSIKNNGNMTSYGTPVYVFVSTQHKTGVSKIIINGLDLPRIIDGIEKDSIPLSEYQHVEELSDKIGDTHYFIGNTIKSSESQDSLYAYSAYFFTDVAPMSVKKFTIDVFANEIVEVYVTIPSENISYSSHPHPQYTTAQAEKRNSIKDNYCCIRNKVECVATIAADVAGITNTVMSLTGAPHAAAAGVADCLASSVNQVISTTGTVFCDDNSVENSLWDKIHSVLGGLSITGMLSSCASKVLPWKKVNDLLAAVGDVSGNASMVFGLGVDVVDCVQAFLSKVPNCPPRPKTKGGKSTPVNSFDPNDIYGYTSASGSRFMSDSIQNVSYRIEFENDTTFATASAHMVEVKDTLDARYFDLASYAPTGFKIGDKTEYIEGTPQFVKTVDMRPQINAIVQVEGLYDKQKGIATWRFTSLDPMTMEPTDDVMQGFLPVNYDGESGIGEVTFDVALRQKFTDGTEIPNKASIVFDSNEPIMTPVWINTVDAVCPESRVLDVTQKNDTTLTISYEGHDSRSGVWKYEVYAQYGSGNTPWEKVAETAADSCNIDFRFYKSIDYGFCVLAVDSAGNVEQKPLAREGSFADVDMGDVNGDGEVNTLDASLTTAYYLGKQAYIIALAADVNGDGVIDTLDATQITQMFLDAQGIAPETNALPRRRVKPKQTLQP